MSIIDKILSREEFQQQPPVLIDIGASGEVHSKWKQVAKYSTCISFDADSRKMGYIENSKHFKKQFVYNCIAGERKSDFGDFYLTKSPFCSSTLLPDNTALDNYAFAEKFELERKVQLKTIDLPTVINELKLDKVDWFKTDSQGTDLRLFQSMGDKIIRKVIVAEFEPGIIDAYNGEDKLHALIAYMDQKKFWMSDMNVKGSQRIHRSIKNKSFNNLQKKLLPAVLKTSPGWAEVVYFNSFHENDLFTKRDLLLAYVFAITRKQYGFAMEIAENGLTKFNDIVFKEMKNYAYREIIMKSWNMPFYIFKVFWNKIFGN